MSTSITASAKDWIAALTFVGPSISHRPPMPVLGCVHIDPAKGTVFGFDFEITAQADLPEFEGKGTPFLAYFGTLIDSIKMTTRLDKSAPVTLTPSKGEDGFFVTLEAAGYKLILGSGDVAEYPDAKPPKVDDAFTLSGPAFKAAINRSLIAASKDDTLPILTGVKFEQEGGTVTMMATDRYRLAMNTLPCIGKGESKSTNQFLLKSRTLAEVAKRAGTGTVYVGIVDGGGVRFVLPGGTFQTLTIDGDYPKIRSLFPEGAPIGYVVDRVPLLEASKVAARLAERNTPLVLKVDGSGIVVSFADGLFGPSYAPKAKGEFTKGSEPFEVAFTPRYLIDPLNALRGERVLLHFTSSPKPVMVTEIDDTESHRHLIMPVRMPQGVAR